MNLLITGGASGLGDSITRHQAQKENGKVYITYCNSESKANDLKSTFANVHTHKCNFDNSNDIELLKSKIKEWDIDVLVNNAHNKIEAGHFHKKESQEFLDDFTRNVLPTVSLMQAAIEHFRKKKSGKIVTILTSFLVGGAPAGYSDYIAGKAYLLSISNSINQENQRFNISSNCVSPSFMKTGFNADVDERLVENIVENHPFKELLSPEETARVVSFFIESSNQVRGVHFPINAGVNVL